jgi:DNA-binding NarL/FixJ family response regulator
MSIRVCIFDDHEGVLQGLVHLLQAAPQFNMTGAYNNTRHLIEKVEEASPDVILMDIQMPGINGIEAVKTIRQNFPDVKIIMQTVFEDDDKILASIYAGASGYILKNSPPEKFLSAIEEVYQGGAPMTGSVAARVLDLFKNQGKSISEGNALSSREREILQYLVQGLSYKMIAGKCGISYDTVRFHMKNIYTKLNVTSMTEVVAKAIQQRIV